MTPSEQDSLDTFEEVIRYLTDRQGNMHEFVDIMGQIMKITKQLHKLKAGCPTGHHFSPCTCKSATVGHLRNHAPAQLVR